MYFISFICRLLLLFFIRVFGGICSMRQVQLLDETDAQIQKTFCYGETAVQCSGDSLMKCPTVQLYANCIERFVNVFPRTAFQNR